MTPEETIPDGTQPVPNDLELASATTVNNDIERASTPESGIFQDQLSRQPAKSAKKGPDSLETFVHPDNQPKPPETMWSKMKGWWE